MTTLEGSLEKQDQQAEAATAPVRLTPDQSLKDLISGVSDLCNFVINVSHGFSLKEIWEAITLLGDVKGLVAEAPTLVAQYKALDSDARADLMAYVSANVSFPANANVQDIVEKVLDVAVALSAVLQLIVPAPAAG